MSLTLRDLALRIGAKLSGDGMVEVRGCAALGQASVGDLALIADGAEAPANGAVLVVSPQDAARLPGRPLLVADDPAAAFRAALVELHGFRNHPAPGIDEHAFVDPTAIIGELCTFRPFVYISPRVRMGKRCIVYPHCYIGKDTLIGDDAVLYPNVNIYDHCQLGNRVTIHASSALGSDAFEYLSRDGQHKKLPPVGLVVVEDDVEIGANVVIQRPTVGETRIGKGSKIADGVVIAAGTRIAPHTLVDGPAKP